MRRKSTSLIQQTYNKTTYNTIGIRNIFNNIRPNSTQNRLMSILKRKKYRMRA